jgi:hypothetical protein
MIRQQKPYRTPALVELGSVQALTLGGGHGGHGGHSGGHITKSGIGHDGGGMKKTCITTGHH